MDGRIAIIEYKGGHLARNPDELHKEAVGQLWEERSGGRCVFARIVDRDWQRLDTVLRPL